MTTRPNKPGNVSDKQIPGTVPTFTEDSGSTPQRQNTDSATEQAKAQAQQAGAAAKDEAGRVAEHAKEGGRQVAAEAKAQAGEVADQARRQVGDLVGQARSAATAQAGLQQQRAANTVRGYADEVQSLLSGNPQQGVVTDLAHTASDRISDAAQWLENREPQELVDELTRFARRRPVAFLAAAAGAGFLMGRLGRGVKDAGSDDDQAIYRPGYSYSDRTVATSYGQPQSERHEWSADVAAGDGVLGQGEYR